MQCAQSSDRKMRKVSNQSWLYSGVKSCVSVKIVVYMALTCRIYIYIYIYIYIIKKIKKGNKWLN